MIFRSSFLWRYLIANESDCWMFMDEHMDLSASALKKILSEDKDILQTTRLSNKNVQVFHDMYKWSFCDHVPKQFIVSGKFRLETDNNELVTKLYRRAHVISPFSEHLTLAAVLEDFCSSKMDGTYHVNYHFFSVPFNC